MRPGESGWLPVNIVGSQVFGVVVVRFVAQLGIGKNIGDAEIWSHRPTQGYSSAGRSPVSTEAPRKAPVRAKLLIQGTTGDAQLGGAATAGRKGLNDGFVVLTTKIATGWSLIVP